MTSPSSSEEPQAALSRLVDALGASATDEQLERILPIVARLLRSELRSDLPYDLGEIEPAFSLRYDRGDWIDSERAGS